MIEHTIQLPRPEGEMEVFVVHPAGGGASPAVILYMDMWGFRATLCDIAHGMAAAGYPGVVRALEILRADVDRTLRLLGCQSIAALDASYVDFPQHWRR